MFIVFTGVRDPVFAQHAFIQAVQVQAGNVQAWSNLGTLYLTLGDAELAHKAFAAAQRTEPSYVQCWVGQVRKSVFFIYLFIPT